MSSSLHQTKDSTLCLACSTTQQPALKFIPDKISTNATANQCTKLEIPELQFMEQSEALPTYLPTYLETRSGPRTPGAWPCRRSMSSRRCSPRARGCRRRTAARGWRSRCRSTATTTSCSRCRPAPGTPVWRDAPALAAPRPRPPQPLPRPPPRWRRQWRWWCGR